MDLICEDDDVLHKLVGENSLRDSEIEKYEISQGESVSVDVLFRMSPKSDWPKILLRFSCCEYYSLHGHNDRPVCVSHLKLFISDEGKFYASFDPYDEERVVSDEDNDVIYSERIQAYMVPMS